MKEETGLIYLDSSQKMKENEQHIKLQSCAKNIGKLRKLRKSRNHKLNINEIYNEKLRNNYLQQLPTFSQL